jgi:hypothetical protein
MARCKHVNVILTEYGTASACHIFGNGRYEFNTQSSQIDTARCFISCVDCGFRKSFCRLNKNLPKWLKVYLEQLEAVDQIPAVSAEEFKSVQADNEEFARNQTLRA